MPKLNELISQAEAAISAYNEGMPIMSDVEFDALLLEIEALDPDAAILDEVGGADAVSGLEATDILLDKYKMFSIKPIYSEESLLKNVRVIPNKEYHYSLKENGFAVRLVYSEDGTFLSATTRGRKTKGLDITEKMRLIVPTSIDTCELTEIRGELNITSANWDELKRRYPEKQFVTATNSIPFSYSAQSSDEDMQLFMFCAYSIVGDNRDITGATFTEMYSKLRSFGFETTLEKTVKCQDIDDVRELIDVFSLTKDTHSRDTDGIVMCLNNLDGFYAAQPSGKYRPTAFALKIGAWANAIYSAKVTAIVWAKGKEGFIPKAEIEPTMTRYGKTVSVVSLHNPAIMFENNVLPGCTIEFEYIGDINPYFKGVITGPDGSYVQTSPKRDFGVKSGGTTKKFSSPRARKVGSPVHSVDDIIAMYGLDETAGE